MVLKVKFMELLKGCYKELVTGFGFVMDYWRGFRDVGFVLG